MTTTKYTWDIPIGALVSPCPIKTAYSAKHPSYQVGVVVDRRHHGTGYYQVHWNSVAGNSWWMLDELIVLSEGGSQ